MNSSLTREKTDLGEKKKKKNLSSVLSQMLDHDSGAHINTKKN